MAYRLGVDVGGTFTDLFLVEDGNGDGGGRFRVKTPSTPADPSEGVLTGVQRICAEAGIDVGDIRNILHGTTVATNAVLESKGARVGLITTQGLPADPAPGALANAGAARGLDHHDQAGPAGLAGGHPRGGRAHGLRREHDRPRGREAGRGRRPQPRRVGRRDADRGADQLVRERRARAGDRRDRRAALPGLPRDALVGGAAGVPRVRARADRLHELVRAAEGGRLRQPAPGTAERDRRAGGREHPPLGRGADDDARGGAQPDLRRALGPVRRRRRRPLRRPEGRLRGHPHLRHGRDVHRRRALPERPADDRPRDRHRPLQDQGALRRRAHRRRGRRLDRPRARS